MKPAIPLPRGGFASDEDEARWLTDTIAMRMCETVEAIVGRSVIIPNTDSLYELLLFGLQSAGRRALRRAPSPGTPSQAAAGDGQ